MAVSHARRPRNERRASSTMVGSRAWSAEWQHSGKIDKRCPAPRAQPRCNPFIQSRPDGPPRPRDPTKSPGLTPRAAPRPCPAGPTTSGAATSVIRVRIPCERPNVLFVARRRRGQGSARLVTAATCWSILRTGRNAAEARIHELATDAVHIEELPAGDDLEERIADALEKCSRRRLPRSEENRGAALSFARARRRLKHEKQSYETKQDAKVLKGDLFAQVLQRDRNEENAAIMRKQHATMRRRKFKVGGCSETILIRKRCVCMWPDQPGCDIEDSAMTRPRWLHQR